MFWESSAKRSTEERVLMRVNDLACANSLYFFVFRVAGCTIFVLDFPPGFERSRPICTLDEAEIF